MSIPLQSSVLLAARIAAAGVVVINVCSWCHAAKGTSASTQVGSTLEREEGAISR